MIHHTHRLRFGVLGLMLGCATVIGGATAIVSAQDSTATKQTKRVNEGGRDPFRKYEVPKVPVRKSGQVMPPSIQERIEQYKAQKVAAMNARIAAPKPTTALLLNEIQVVGITRTPRGYAAIVEATPIRLSYVVYPGERFYDGQLVAIEDNRLVFRRETVFADGRRDRVVELKSLRQPSSVDAMTAAKSAGTTTAPTTTPEQKPEPKPAASEKP